MKIEIINKEMLCWDNDPDINEKFHVLAKISSEKIAYPIKALNEKGTIVAYKHATPLPTEQRDINNLEVGDIIIDDDGDKNKVLADLGNNIYVLSTDNDYNTANDVYTLHELIQDRCKLYNPLESTESDIVELTFEDISKGKGKGIDPDKLRIKE